MDREIKPCPFCGGNVVLHTEIRKPYHGSEKYGYVASIDHNCNGGIRSHGLELFYSEKNDAATIALYQGMADRLVANWNRRGPEREAVRYYEDRLRPTVDNETGATEDEIDRLELALNLANQDKRRFRDNGERAEAQRDALKEALDYLLKETVDEDLKHGITLTEGKEEARVLAMNVIAALEDWK